MSGFSAIWYVLDTTQRADTRRMLPTFLRALFGVFILLVVLIPLYAASLESPFGMSPDFTSGVLKAFYFASLVGLLLLSGWTASAYAGGTHSGFISLLALTGLSPQKWLAIRAVQVLVSFSSFWIVRLPALLLLHTFGNVDWMTVAILEMLLIAVFCCLTTHALWFGNTASTSNEIYGYPWVFAIFWEIMANALSLISLLLSLAQLARIPSLDLLDGFVSRFSVVRRVVFLGETTEQIPWILGQSGLFLACAGLFALMFVRTVYNNIGADIALAEQPLSKPAEKLQTQQRPRCWDDSLTWQAYYLILGGNVSYYTRIGFYLLLMMIVVVFNLLGWDLAGSSWLFFMGGGLITNTFFVSAMGLVVEVKNQTLESLTLAIGDPLDLYRGWRRGANRMGLPDLILLPLLLIAVAFNSLDYAYILASILVGLYLCAPLGFFMFFLRTHTLRNWLAGGGIVAVFVVLAGLAVPVGVWLSPYLIPVFCMPLIYGLNYYIHYHCMPIWFDPLIESN